MNSIRTHVRAHVDVVLRIAGLLDAGLPTRIIEQLLSCLEQPQTIYVPNVTPEKVATLQREQARLTERVECLARNRDAIAAYLDEVLRMRSANLAWDPQGP